MRGETQETVQHYDPLPGAPVPLTAALWVPGQMREIVREHDLRVWGDPRRWAVFSRDERYRYLLATEVHPEGSGCNGFCGLNPSTATHLPGPEGQDNTHTKCMEFTRRWGYRYNWMLNVFAIRGTDPKTIKRADDPVGPANTAVLHLAAVYLDRFVCGWGRHGNHLARGARVRREVLAQRQEVHVLGINDDGSPEHPLYIPYERAPEVWRV